LNRSVRKTFGRRGNFLEEEISMGSKISIFTIPAHFEGIYTIRQINAIKSWLLLEPQPEILLCGDDAGVSTAAKNLGCCHIPEIKRNPWGTPLINDAFEKVQSVATYDTICYMNTDIIILDGFTEAAELAANKFKQYLIVGRRWDYDITKLLNFSFSGWRQRLWKAVQEKGRLHAICGLDYFIFPRGLYKNVLPFAVGRSAFDNWLMSHIVRRKIPTIDATNMIRIVHQNMGGSFPLNNERQVNQDLYHQDKGNVVGQTTDATWEIRKGKIIKR